LEDASVRILVIDDDRAVLFTIAAPLKAEGFEVVTAHSGAEGLQTFQQSPFDLVIVDIFMPGMDGVKVIKKFRHHCPRIPIIAISGMVLRSSGRTALDLFPMLPILADIPCVRKPFKPKELVSAVLSLVGAPARAG
jgi:CheY-like chemotaxis protein